MNKKIKILTIATCLVAGVQAVRAEAIKVEVIKTEGGGFELLRGGEPYRIKGAGAPRIESLESLAAAGANSVRIWGSDPLATRAYLDKAHELGLSVMVGIWIRKLKTFDYSDKAAVQQQYDRAMAVIRAYKDHPAVLAWAIGNEMEGRGDNTLLFQAIGAIARDAARIDPNHPTTTVLIGVSGDKLKWIQEHAPDLDIVGINRYGDAATRQPDVFKNIQNKKPLAPMFVAEYGPPGWWTVKKTAFGAPLEPLGMAKAEMYKRIYVALAKSSDVCLGSYAFIWDRKWEGTATWFGMHLPDGTRTRVIDVMQELWSGEPPANLSPVVTSIETDSLQVAPGATVQVRIVIEDPDDTKHRTKWMLYPEVSRYATAGGADELATAEIENAVVKSDTHTATVKMPEKPGVYRLYAYVYDENNGGATANVPFQVVAAE